MFTNVGVSASLVDMGEASGMQEIESSAQGIRLVEGISTRGHAPGLTSIEFIGLYLDDNNYVHIGIREIGTSRTRIVK